MLINNDKNFILNDYPKKDVSPNKIKGNENIIENDKLLFKDNLNKEIDKTGNTKSKIDFIDEHNFMKPEAKKTAEKLTSLFENSTFELQYNYAEHLDDGRGITAGRAGFTTATGDLYEVVEKYNEIKPNNVLSKYAPILRELASKGSSSVKGLDSLIKDWGKASTDKTFRDVQDSVVDEMYYKPAMEHSEKLGLKTNLAKAFVYDTIIQHGDGSDPDGLQALIDKTNKIMNGNPKTGVDEKKWLETFIKVRKADLSYSNAQETRKVWQESTSRCDVFTSLAKSGNYDLHKPLNIHTKEYNLILN